ncbi:hypothetical protein [Oligoflexus tunisiensis]|uniref:hypothetical protein n=1 Tax=Oligoflexus tunisiensis TaxID=708132 RepID=UPI001C4031E0|nr:hypothetical protein [Oligoflexus tunisiensis]
MRGILFLLSVAATPGYAAKVVKIDAQRKVVMIDEGTNTQYVKKAKVCFYDASNVKVGCSFIRTAKPKFSFIKIRGEKLFAKIQVGMMAKMEGAPPAPGTPPGITGEIPSPVPATPTDSPKSYVTGLFLLPLAGPITYQNLVYETPVGRQVDSMWSSDSPVSNLGFGLELGLGISSFQLTAGLRSRFFTPKKISSDYNDADGDNQFEQFMDTTAPGTSFGAWVDFYWLIVDFGVVDFRLGNGIEFDSSTVNFEAKQLSDLNDESNTMYSAKSTLTALSLRILPTLDFIFGPIDFTLGTVIYIPVSQSSKFNLGESNDPFVSFLNEGKSPEQDLKDSLKHEAKPGADLLISAGFVF